MALVPVSVGPPCWVVVFASRRSDSDPDEYAATAARMSELAGQQPGFLGEDSARGPDGVGLTVSYWASRQAIDDWRRQAEHAVAQQLGRTRFYEAFTLRVAEVVSARGEHA